MVSWKEAALHNLPLASCLVGEVGDDGLSVFRLYQVAHKAVAPLGGEAFLVGAEFVEPGFAEEQF